MFKRLTIETITFDEYKLHLPWEDMVLYRNVMQVNIYIKKYEDSEYKEEFPRNLRFMSAIQSLTINQDQSKRWEQINTLWFKQLETITYNFIGDYYRVKDFHHWPALCLVNNFSP
jgi:hypothetical protein